MQRNKLCMKATRFPFILLSLNAETFQWLLCANAIFLVITYWPYEARVALTRGCVMSFSINTYIEWDALQHHSAPPINNSTPLFALKMRCF